MAAIGTAEANRIYALAAERGLTEDQVDELAHDMRLMMGTVGIDGLSRSSARQLIAALPAAPPAPRPDLRQPEARQCTPKQAQYVADLLARRARTGEGGGFAAVSHLYTADGQLDLPAIDALSFDAASRIITSLKGDY
jgi:hypothetical protein